MSYHLSRTKGAQTIIDQLEKLGATITPEMLFRIELILLEFHTKPVYQVMGTLMRKPTTNPLGRLASIQEQGWDYFDRPVRQIIGKKPKVRRRFELDLVEGAQAVHHLVVRWVAETVLSPKEMAEIILEIPQITTDTKSILLSFRAADNQGVASCSYLLGILRRQRDNDKAAISRMRDYLEELEVPDAPVRTLSDDDIDTAMNAYERVRQMKDALKGLGF